MKIVISNILSIQNPNSSVLTWCNKNLIFKNPDYQKKIKLGKWTGSTPKYITLFDYCSPESMLYLPSTCYEYIEQFLGDGDEVMDCRVEVSANIVSKMKLRDYQEYAMIPFTTKFHHHDTGLLIAFPGLGKTNMALEIAARLKQKTLWLTHTRDLCLQAQKRCHETLFCKTSLITDGNVDTSGDIVIATVQTLVKNLDKIPQNTFGLVVIDECHHTFISGESVGMFQQCIEYFAARHKMGMSGTLSRSDSLEVCIPYLIGKVAYETKEEDKDYVVYIDNKEFFRFDKSKYLTPTKVNFIKTNFSISTTDEYGIVQYKDVFDKSGMTISFAKLMNEICSDKERNQQVIDVANSISGSTIILSDRVSQLEYLHEHIPNSVLITGNTKKKDREQALKDVYDGKIKTLCASYKICKEGVDCPILANLILASPIKDNGTVEQCVGRIRRVYDGKTVANVYDFVDSEVSTLQRFYYKRKGIFKKKGWL